jgi:hypothetical protein
MHNESQHWFLPFHGQPEKRAKNEKAGSDPGLFLVQNESLVCAWTPACTNPGLLSLVFAGRRCHG